MRTSAFTTACLAVLALAAAAPFTSAAADPLTRQKCWTAKWESGSERTLCFVAPSRTTMNNRNQVANSKNWSTCNWTGVYFENGSKVIVTFGPASGRCSNRAASPQFVTVCDFNEKTLECVGSSIVDGKTLQFGGTFE